jgi:hypothetical protein
MIRKKWKCNKEKSDMYSYHEKGKGSTKKHQQATSTDMLWIIEVIVSSKFIPRIKN